MKNNGSELEDLQERLGMYDFMLALDNAPNQVVFGGLDEGLMNAEAYLKEAGIKTARLPKIEGPFHTRYEIGPALQTQPLIEKTQFSYPKIPTWANSRGTIIESPEQFRDESFYQIFRQVLWRQIVQGMIEKEIGRFVIIDPSYNGEGAISGTIERMKPDAEILTIKDAATLDDVMARLSAYRA